MKKFATRLQIKGSESEVEALIPKLINLGYVWKASERHDFHVYSILSTDYNFYIGGLGFTDRGFVDCIDASNQELILALAAMTEGTEYYAGEDAVSLGNADRSFSNGSLYKVKQMRNDGMIMTEIDDKGSNTNGWHKKEFRKATEEEIIKHFELKNMSLLNGISESGTFSRKEGPRKVIGYTLKKAYPGMRASLLGASFDIECVENGELSLRARCRDITIKKSEAEKFPEFFDPIYKEIEKVVTLSSDSGTFQLTVSKKGIYYAPDNAYLDVKQLKKLFHKKINEFDINANRALSNSATSSYKFIPICTHIDSGCKKNVPMADWLQVLEVYDEIIYNENIIKISI